MSIIKSINKPAPGRTNSMESYQKSCNFTITDSLAQKGSEGTPKAGFEQKARQFITCQ